MEPPSAFIPDDREDGLAIETAVFPAWDVLPTESDRPESDALAGRQRVLARLRQIRGGFVDSGVDERLRDPLPEAFVLVAPVTALLQPCESPEETAPALVLRQGATWDPILLGRKLDELGYERTGQVEVRGEFALRGGILDVYPYAADHPFRFDFDGDTIESIRPFDPFSQRSAEPVAAVTFADSSPQHLRRLFMSGGSERPMSLLDHLPPESLIVWLDPGRLHERAELYMASLVSGRNLHFDYEHVCADVARRFDSLELSEEPGARSEAGGADTGEGQSPIVHRASAIACTSLQRLQGEILGHAAEWKKLAAVRSAVYVFCETPGDQKRLSSLLTEAGVLPAPSVKLVIGRISGGFDLRAAGFSAIADFEILGRHKHVAVGTGKQRRYAAFTRPLSSLFELQTGDYVVHTTYGIARYLGLERLDKSGRLEDYLTLLFADEVKLYVPAAHIHLVGRYIGGEATPGLSRLGSKAWARKKERARELLKDIAEDLLKTQAARHSRPGICFGPDAEWQAAFEAAFPYEETPDQLDAIVAVKQDMEATCPMDRLLCGDVGFGKTEVALRAAFKAVSAGKQVAVLTPTTLLCEQHGRTFTERCAGYPVSIETISRFKSGREKRTILERLATGRLDIIIGTHRLIQKDVRFKDLGLAVIDEEQRFGVEHKEFFKRLRATVDVLTLTATPIPRTLHMALLGLRDISNLMIAPRNRHPVQTRVARVNDDLMRRAMLRELSRGGQVFVVHPRVRDIQDFAARLAKLVPEGHFGVGHGQMDGDELEDVMSRFLSGEVQVLVSTTIVENGLDIPTANTILIHEADRFGLAELHQLRGRVGRSEIHAFCYLLLPEHRVMTPEGLRRLRALEEYDELGAGFQIALKDLEIRGAGNALGVEQSGQIAEIGYDLYCKLLESTVKQLKGEPVPEEEIEVNLQLSGASYLPETYIEDQKAVLEFYRRLKAACDDKELEALRVEAEDRFGPLPDPASRLFAEMPLRRLAAAANVPYVGIDKAEGRLMCKFFEWDLRATDYALRGLPQAKDVRVLDTETLSFHLSLKAKHHEDVLRADIRELLEVLADFRKKRGTKASRLRK
jgi:transcription-repair coupling factor (superfamily II helicase)